MRASTLIRTHAPHRVELLRCAVRAATIALVLVVFQFASAASAFVAKAHAQSLLPTLKADVDGKDLVRAELVAEASALAPGRRFRLAVRFEIKDGWHLNWLNPGDAGLAPGVEWKVPKGFKTSMMCWPYPGRFPTGPLVIFGYSKELLLVTEVTPPADLRPGDSVLLEADVTWLACEEACVPGSASLSLRLPTEASARLDANGAARLDAWSARCPALSGPWSVDASLGDEGTLLLELQTAREEGAVVERAFFYPYEQGMIENAAPQLLSALQGPFGRVAYQLRVEFSRLAPRVPDRARGVLVMESGGPRAIEVDVPLRTR